MAPKKVVYVSCDPATLARDVKILCEKGYCLTHAEAVDLFPRCSHIESIVCLHKLDSYDDLELECYSVYQELKDKYPLLWTHSFF